MTGRGQISVQPKRSLKLLLVLQLIWLAVVCLLGAWWVQLVRMQSVRIQVLEALVTRSQHLGDTWMPTHRMIFWESLTFFLLLIGITAILFWMYWRDARRARALQSFFASVTHELRTPLTSIRLQAESIADAAQGDSPGGVDPALVRRLLEDTTRLESQVERTLELARVEGGGPVFLQPLSLKSWLERAVSQWQESSRDELMIQAELPESCQQLMIQADPAAVQVVLKNLVENSIRHSGKTPVEVRMWAEHQPGRVLLHYRDNGNGFSGNLSQLGKLFQKGPASTGAGVGLYLVQILMKRMGGDALFESRAEGGFETTLTFQEAGT